jgi:hypothetical protein
VDPLLLRVVRLQLSEPTTTCVTSETLAVMEVLLYVAVSTTDWLPAIVPAVAVNVLEVAPAATVADPGTVSRALLLDKATTAPPAGAACESVTVQVDDELDPRLPGVQESEVGTTGAVRFT